MFYFVCFASSLILTLVLTPLVRFLALKFHVLDFPHTEIKTHKIPTPYLGGISIFVSFIVSLLIIRFLTSFPTGTLHAIRGIFLGGVLIIGLGLFDDIKPQGLSFKTKFFWQIATAVLLILFDIRIKFISPRYMGDILTILWVVGIINAVNIVDIMDGLAGGIAVIASLTFLFISLPGEQIYVNFVGVALAGACLGFLPYNFSNKHKIFLGDTGSLFVGYVLAAVSLGTTYTQLNKIALFAPILILGIPIYDTFFVTYHRLKQGVSPFLGSRDHFALRLEKAGYSRKKIILLVYLFSLLLSLSAFIVTRLNIFIAVSTYLIVFIVALFLSSKLSKIKPGVR